MTVRGLYAIADDAFNPLESMEELVRRFLEGGARIVQLRMKRPAGAGGAWERRVLDTARSIAALKQRMPFTFVVNDHVDVAVEVGADGVHLGAGDMAVSEAVRRLPPGMMVGYSSHAVGEALAAAGAGAHYVAFGAIYPTATKGPGHPVQGIERLREIVDASSVPVVAIGGIHRGNIDQVMSTGVSSVAMITGLCGAASIEAETKWFVDRINGYA